MVQWAYQTVLVASLSIDNTLGYFVNNQIAQFALYYFKVVCYQSLLLDEWQAFPLTILSFHFFNIFPTFKAFAKP